MEALAEMIPVVLRANHFVERDFRWTVVAPVTLNRVPWHRKCAGVLDVEPGCAPIEAAPPWVRARRRLLPDAYPPILYANRTTLTPLFNALEADGLHVVRDFRLWIATLDGTRKVADMTGVTAVQYKRGRNRDEQGHWTEEPGPAVAEGHFDESIVYDDEWHHHA